MFNKTKACIIYIYIITFMALPCHIDRVACEIIFTYFCFQHGNTRHMVALYALDIRAININNKWLLSQVISNASHSCNNWKLSAVMKNEMEKLRSWSGWIQLFIVQHSISIFETHTSKLNRKIHNSFALRN